MGKQLYNYTNLLNNFSKNMKKRRLELNLSQKQLADIVGISVKTIQNYEKKKTIPTSAVMESISVALKSSLNSMIDDKNINKKIALAEILDKIEHNTVYEFILEDLNITSKLFDIIDLEIRRNNNNLPEHILNNTLGGILDISYDDKYYLVQAKLQHELEFEIKRIKNEYFNRYEDVKHIYRSINTITGKAIDKKKY